MKTAIAIVSALVLASSYVSAQARPNTAAQVRPITRDEIPSRGCVSSTMEEGTRSAYPAWAICQP